MRTALIPVLLAPWLATAAPELPDWGESEVPAAGGLLVSDESGPVLATDIDPPEDEEISDPSEFTPVPEAFLDDYFAARPSNFLIDPQELLAPRERERRTEFLAYHAGDSKIDLNVYLFDGGQEIPETVRLEEVAERLFSDGKPSLFAYYFLGAPERTMLRASPDLAESLEPTELRRLMQGAIHSAREKEGATEQLEAFCIQASIRIYWMERAAGLAADEHELMTPVVKAGPVPEPGRAERMKRWMQQSAERWGVLGGFGLAAVVVLGGGVWFSRRRMRFRFAEFEVEPRLGGNHAAGIGAVIHFGNTTQSPTRQHSEPGDCLGGI